MNPNIHFIFLLFAILALTSAASSIWLEDEEPSYPFRAFRIVPTRSLSSMENTRHMLKRADFNKRRGRELFGKRSSIPIDVMTAVEGDNGMIFENRYRRRANELFG